MVTRTAISAPFSQSKAERSLRKDLRVFKIEAMWRDGRPAGGRLSHFFVFGSGGKEYSVRILEEGAHGGSSDKAFRAYH